MTVDCRTLPAIGAGDDLLAAAKRTRFWLCELLKSMGGDAPGLSQTILKLDAAIAEAERT